MSSARRRLRPLDHLPDGGVLARDLPALVVGQGVDVEKQRLLDLGVVEQVAEALRRQLGMVGKHDRGTENRRVPIAQQDGKRVDGLARQSGLALGALPLERRDEAPALHLHHWMCRDQAVMERLAAGDLGRVGPHLGLVVHAEPEARQLRSQELRAHRDAPAELAALHREAELAPQRPARELRQRHRAQLERALLGLVALPARLEEEDRAVEARVGARREHGLEPQHREGRRLSVGVGRRVDDPERRRGRVLDAGRVRVEGVALVEQRPDQLLDRAIHRSSPWRAAR